MCIGTRSLSDRIERKQPLDEYLDCGVVYMLLDELLLVFLCCVFKGELTGLALKS